MMEDLVWKPQLHTPDMTVAVDDAARDEGWRKRLEAGDHTVIAELYDGFAPSLYRVLMAILGSSADSEDALQEVFVHLAQGRAHRIQGFRPYLFAAARNQAISILRRKRRERPLDERPEFAVVEEREPLVDVQALLLMLPVDQREVVAMKVYEEMTFAEIARIVKASPNTVASRYRYGIERLRRWSQEEVDNGK